MNMSNIGIGVGAFANGLLNGVGIGRTLKKVGNENEIEAIRKNGLADAGEQHDKLVNSNIQSLIAPGEGGLAGQVYSVGDQTFADHDKAEAAAEKNAPTKEELFLKNAVPKMEEAYLSQGNPKMAAAWRQYADGKRGQAAIKDWAKGYMSAQAGNWDKAANIFGGYYTDYIDDDVDYVGHKTLKDGKGNVTGFNLELKDKSTGKTSQVPMSLDSLRQLAMAYNPKSLFEMTMKQSLAADKARLEDAAGARKYAREQGGRVELATLNAQLKNAGEQRAFNRKMEALRQAGYSPEFINRALPSILGIDASGPYKKSASPEEARRMLLTEMIKNPMTRRMSQDEINSRVDDLMKIIYSDKAGAAPTGPAGGLPGGSGAPQQQSRGVPVLDTQTGKIVYR